MQRARLQCIYAVHPATQRSKWMAIDADCRTTLQDLVKVQRQLRKDGIAAALEILERGGFARGMSAMANLIEFPATA